MKTIAALLALLALSPAMAQDNKYVGTGMSVTGPASEKKPVTQVSVSRAKTDAPKTTAGANGTSDEETPGVNSAVSNSH